MASIIKLLRNPKEDIKKETVSFAIQLDPENSTDVATISVPVFEAGDVEDWLEWRKSFQRLLSLKEISHGPILFRHARILLAGDSLKKFDNIAATTAPTETTECFHTTLQEFTNKMIPAYTAKRVKRYLLEVQKPVYMSVAQFVVRLQLINSYFPFMPDTDGQNVPLSTKDMKFVLEQAVPPAWRSALEKSGQYENSTFAEVEDYFKILENLEEQTVQSNRGA